MTGSAPPHPRSQPDPRAVGMHSVGRVKPRPGGPRRRPALPGHRRSATRAAGRPRRSRRRRPHRPTSSPSGRAAHRVARTRGQHLAGIGLQPALEQRQQPRQRRLDRLRLEPQRARGRRSSGGNSSARTATLSPIPSTAQRSCGRPSTRIPATLRPSTARRWATSARRPRPPRLLPDLRTASGHRIPGASATATPAASGSSRGGSRTPASTAARVPAARSRSAPGGRAPRSARPR